MKKRLKRILVAWVMNYEKFALVLDTNILQKGDNAKHDFSELNLDSYYKAMNIIELHDITDDINVFIPEIVLLELSSHTLDRINSRITQLNEIKEEFQKIPDINIEIEESFDSKIHIDAIKKFTLKNVNYIEIPEDWSTLFNRVLDMALYKIPPFEKGKGKSDKGFKDAIILLSLVEFAKIEDYTDFVIFSKDQAFKKNEKVLKDFFYQETKKNLEIQQNEKINEYIFEKFNLSSGLKQYLTDYYFLEIEEEMNEIENIFLEEKDLTCNIEEIEIDYENTTLTQLSDEEYDLSVAFKVLLDCEDDEINEINDFNGIYTFKKENNDWKIMDKKFNYKVL